MRNTWMMLKYGILRWIFPKLQKFLPYLADRWSPYLFITPPRRSDTPEDRKWTSKAACTFLELDGKQFASYTWGKGPPVLLIHGWAGRATNYAHFIEPLNAAGYCVTAFDAPAHGDSPGKISNLLEFMQGAEILSAKYGPFKGIIGHSLGAVAAYLIVKKGIQTDCLITLGCPSRQDDIFQTFFIRRLKGDLRCVPYLKSWIKKQYDFDFDKTFPLHNQSLSKPESYLIIHDEEDKESRVEEAKLLQSANPGSKLLITKGLGHNRTLKDPLVISECLRFINK